MKLKFEENIHIKNFDLCVTYDESFTFFVNLLVSILFIVSNHFLLLQIDEVYNEKKQIECSLRQ